MSDAQKMNNDVSHIQITPLKDDKWGWTVWFSTEDDEDDPRDKDGEALSLDEAFAAAKQASLGIVEQTAQPSFKSTGSLDVFSPLARTLVEMHGNAYAEQRHSIMLAIQLALRNHLPPADAINMYEDKGVILILEWGSKSNGLSLIFSDNPVTSYELTRDSVREATMEFDPNAGLPDDAIQALATIMLAKS